MGESRSESGRDSNPDSCSFGKEAEEAEEYGEATSKTGLTGDDMRRQGVGGECKDGI